MSISNDEADGGKIKHEYNNSSEENSNIDLDHDNDLSISDGNAL